MKQTASASPHQRRRSDSRRYHDATDSAKSQGPSSSSPTTRRGGNLKTRSQPGELFYSAASVDFPGLKELQSDFTPTYLQGGVKDSPPQKRNDPHPPPSKEQPNPSVPKKGTHKIASSKARAVDQAPRSRTKSTLLAEDSIPKNSPTGTKRVKGKRVSRPFILGSEAWNLPKPGEPGRPPDIPDEHTKGWRVYVRTPEGAPDISTWLKQVQFKLHPTYGNNVRTIKEAPFEVQETGWGGFHIEMRPYIQGTANEKGSARAHWLQLEPYGTEEEQAEQAKNNLIRSQTLDYIEFNEPVEALYEALQDPGQWDYLKKSKNPGQPQWTSEDLPGVTTEVSSYNKQMEEALVVNLQAALKRVDAIVAQEEQKREEIKKKVAKVNAEIASAQSGDK